MDPTGGKKERWDRAPSTGWSDQTGRGPGTIEPATLKINAKAKTPRCIGEELKIRRSGPKWVRDDSAAVPEGEILQPLSDIPASFSVKGNMMVG